jgi:hypothetical protein
MDPDPDPGGPKTFGCGGSGFGSGSATQHKIITRKQSVQNLSFKAAFLSIFRAKYLPLFTGFRQTVFEPHLLKKLIQV